MRVLIVGSLGGQLSAATKIAMDRGAKVAHVDTIAQATAYLRAGKGADLLMVDVNLDVGSLITANEAERIIVPVIACGVNVRPEAAAGAIKAGAKEFIHLPPEPELIAAVLEAVSDDDRTLIARDPAMLDVVRLAEQIGPSDASVLITGESGVGKEVMARYVHKKSKRASKAFVSVNCAAIPENLLESELFGHEKGAFTGATERSAGKFEAAANGTLFLDEIGDMPLDAQTRLLRVLQDGQFTRIGGRTPIKADVRVIAATHQDLRSLINEGSFREDLFYRLNVVPIRLPPLRDRTEDIPDLARAFLRKAESEGLPRKSIAPDALEALKQQSWPGNVRELENLMKRLAALCADDVISLADVEKELAARPSAAAPERDRGASLGASVESHLRAYFQLHGDSLPPPGLYDRILREVELPLIALTLSATRGNQLRAADLLGINRNTLRKKIRELDIPVTRGKTLM